MEEPKGFSQSESSCNVPLQVLLHYNVIFAALFFAVELAGIFFKIKTYEIDTFRLVLTPLTFMVWSIAEIFRLWFGFSGNLQEKVPQLSAFFLVSIFPQVPCLIYLFTSQGIQLPFDTVASAALLGLNLLEIFFGYQAIHALVSKQTANFFRLVQEEEKSEEEKHLNNNIHFS